MLLFVYLLMCAVVAGGGACPHRTSGATRCAPSPRSTCSTPRGDRRTPGATMRPRWRWLARRGSRSTTDALYAAAYLHDMGGIPPYAVTGVDHGDRSVQLVDSVLAAAGFPMEKAALVKEIIGHHQYYRPPDTLAVAILFRDADILDFLGAIDVARILSVTTRERFAPDLPHAVAMIRRQMTELPAQLQSEAAKREGQRRVLEMQRFLEELAAETDSLRAL